MRLTTAFAVAAALATGVVAAAPTIGQPAPAFTAVDSKGATVSLADFKGKFVVLEWTNDGCPFVQKHYSGGADGNMQRLQRKARDKGAVWLSVISSAPGKQGHVSGEQADALSEQRGAVPTHVLLDESGEVGRLYEAKTTPHMFIVDPEGTLIYAGGIDSIPSADVDDIPKATPYVELALTQAMAGEPVRHPLTKPYGCSIKYWVIPNLSGPELDVAPGLRSA
ncbi:thioredoxin family protein [Sinimarinibacterium thermocellulolyticum]|uniref:Thioredoxin family protein n=1 Tax=Sinimarinibacterium thermocellulolyticum TaxID=3170016 RepID=A0ABV2ADQ5_9GAMM